MADDRIGEGDGAGVVLRIGSFSGTAPFRDGGGNFGFGLALGTAFNAFGDADFCAGAFDVGFGAAFGATAFAFDGDFGSCFAGFDGFAAAFRFAGAGAFAVFLARGFFDDFGGFVLRFVAMLHLKPRHKS